MYVGTVLVEQSLSYYSIILFLCDLKNNNAVVFFTLCLITFHNYIFPMRYNRPDWDGFTFEIETIRNAVSSLRSWLHDRSVLLLDPKWLECVHSHSHTRPPSLARARVISTYRQADFEKSEFWGATHAYVRRQ